MNDDLHTSKLLSVEDAILYVLLRYWDPLCLPSDVDRRGAYERYVEPLRGMLVDSPSYESVLEFLHSARNRDFAVIGSPGSRERRAARKLLEIDIPRDDNE